MGSGAPIRSCITSYLFHGLLHLKYSLQNCILLLREKLCKGVLEDTALKTRSQQTFSLKDKRANILGVVDHRVSCNDSAGVG